MDPYVVFSSYYNEDEGEDNSGGFKVEEPFSFWPDRDLGKVERLQDKMIKRLVFRDHSGKERVYYNIPVSERW